MADQLTDIEKSKYGLMWTFDSYRERSPGMRFLDDAMSRLKMPTGASIVDLGCGTGRVSAALQEKGFDVTAVDIASNSCTEFNGDFVEACLWELPESLGVFDYGFCADVMEHIPTERVPLCLQQISRHVKTCYFQIANFHCHEGDKIGAHLHLSVFPIPWWIEALTKDFDITFAIAERKHHVIVCRSLVF